MSSSGYSGIQHTVATVAMDYPKTRLKMEVWDPERERDFVSYRINATAKEPFTVDFVERIPQGGVFYDIGANVGSYSLIALSRGIVTIAIEPGSENFATLCRNLRLNEYPDQKPFMERAMALPFAVADDVGTTWLDYSNLEAMAASHSLGSPRKKWLHRQRVPVFTLDRLIADFKLPPPTHIKIDTDGNELAVLKGMAGVLDGLTLQGLMIEMPNEIEARIVEVMKGVGWEMTARFDERNGQKIGGIAYAEFARPVAPVMPEMVTAGSPASVVPNGTVAA